MPRKSSKPVPPPASIDPAQYGVSATPEAMQRLIAAVTDSVRDQLAAEYELRVQQQVQEKLQQKIQEIFEQLRLARQRQFGRSSEVLAAQGRLFDEVEALALESTEADEIAPIPAQKGPTIQTSK